MNLKAITTLGLIVFAALIGTAFAATQNAYTIDEVWQSEIREHTRDHMGEFENEDWWLEMEEHWDSNSINSHGCH